MRSRIESWVIVALITKYHIRVDISVQIFDCVARDLSFEGCLGLGIARALASAIPTFLLSIAVNVHVCQGTRPVKEDGFSGYSFLAVGPCC